MTDTKGTITGKIGTSEWKLQLLFKIHLKFERRCLYRIRKMKIIKLKFKYIVGTNQKELTLPVIEGIL
jgi:hypothetical protein